MRVTPLPILAALAAAALAGGCQLVAGVRNDAVLAGGGAGTTSASTTATGGSGGSSAEGGACTPATCADGACVAGACVHPACTAHGPAFDVVTAAEIQSHQLDRHLAAVVTSNQVQVAVLDTVDKKLIVRTVQGGSNPLGPKAELTLTTGGGVSVMQGRASQGTLAFYGRFGDEVGEARFGFDGNGVKPGTGMPAMYSALPSDCTGNLKHAIFGWDTGGATKYVAACEGTSSRALVLGGPTTSEVVATGAPTDASLKLEHLAIADDTLVVVAGDGDSGAFHTRVGKTASELATASPLHFSDVTQKLGVLGLLPRASGSGVTLLGAEYKFKANLYGGVVTDYTKLGDVPPPGIAPVELDVDIAKFGDPGPMIATDTGLFAMSKAFDGVGVQLSWFTEEGEVLLFGAPVYTPEPAAGVTELVGGTVAKTGLDTYVIWIERGAADVVRAQRFLCAY